MKEVIFASEEIRKYLELMKDRGYRTSYTTLVRRTLNRYEEASGGKYDEESITATCNRMFQGSRSRYDYILSIRKFADWLNTGEIQEKKPGKTGRSRPRNCRRMCTYNSAGLRTYRPGEELEKMPNPRTCKYFEEKVTAQAKARKALYWDNLYGRPASYLDSHSAMWAR